MIEIENLKEYSRIEDMSPDGKLKLFIQNDGDIVVSIYGRNMGEMISAQVEFCSTGSGGGRSPKTRDALVDLMRAIEEDNAKRPIYE